jgi:hypothetical protein
MERQDDPLDLNRVALVAVCLARDEKRIAVPVLSA